MDQKRYIILLTAWIGALALFILAYPYIHSYLSKLLLGEHSSAGGVGGAVSAVVGMFVKPLGILVLLTGIGWVNFKRIGWLGLGWGWNVAIVFWLLGSMAFLVGLRNFWGASFGMGLLYLSLPFSVLFLLVFMVFLTLWRGKTSGKVSPPLWLIAGITVGYAIYILRVTIVMGIATIPILGAFFMKFWMSVGAILTPINAIISFGLPGRFVLSVSLAIFAAALALVLLLESFNGDALQKTNTR